MTYVYVLNSHGEPLMPCSPRKARLLLKSNSAIVKKRTPFTVQLLNGASGYKQPVTLGVDAGSKTVGLSATTEKKELFAAELKPRNDIVKLLEAKREFRRNRRNRKTRYREARFDNRVRSKHKGWLAPSVEVKIDEHIKGIKLVTKILPVTKIIVETAEFDLQAIKAMLNGQKKPHGVEYQHGEMFGMYNTRQYVLYRDSYTCRCCGKKSGKLYVVKADGEETISPEDSYTVCEDCFKARAFHFKKKRHWTHPTFMGIMRKTLMERLKKGFPAEIVIEETMGATTKMVRENYGIDKSHINDARCISEHPLATPVSETFLMKPVRKRNRSLHQATIRKGGVRNANQAPKYVFGHQLFDKVSYNGIECFIFARRSSGSFDIRKLGGEKVNAGVTYKKLRLLEKRKTILIERREASFPPTAEVTDFPAP